MSKLASLGTALITGASAGLGAEFAVQLAQQGYDLLLAARRLDRLQTLADSIQHRKPVRIEVLSADLATDEGIQSVEQKIRACTNLSLLVNNAGFGLRGRFSTQPVEKHLAMIQVHVIASVRLTHAALPGMLSRQKGGIINVASMAAFLPLRNSTYSSTKAYLVNFSEALESELGRKGIHAQALCPGFTYTEFHDTQELKGFPRSRLPRWLWLDADMVVRSSLNALGSGQVICIPGWQYKLVYLLTRGLITSTLIKLISKMVLSDKF